MAGKTIVLRGNIEKIQIDTKNRRYTIPIVFQRGQNPDVKMDSLLDLADNAIEIRLESMQEQMDLGTQDHTEEVPEGHVPCPKCEGSGEVTKETDRGGIKTTEFATCDICEGKKYVPDDTEEANWQEIPEGFESCSKCEGTGNVQDQRSKKIRKLIKCKSCDGDGVIPKPGNKTKRKGSKVSPQKRLSAGTH